MHPNQTYIPVSPTNSLSRTLAIPLLLVFAVLMLGCAGSPESQTQYIWKKAHGTTEARNEALAAGNVAALQAYPDPISMQQMESEPIGAPAIRREKRNQIITDYMLAHGWHLEAQSNR